MDLPEDVLDIVFAHLSLADTFVAARVCHGFRKVAHTRRRDLFALATTVGREGAKAAPIVTNITESTCRTGQWWFDMSPHYYCMFPTITPAPTFAICTFDVVLPWYVAEVVQPTGPIKVWWERFNHPTAHPDAAAVFIGLLLKAANRSKPPLVTVWRKGRPDVHMSMEEFFGLWPILSQGSHGRIPCPSTIAP